MRVSEFYELNRTQAELDFVDVDIENDVRLYIDPKAIEQLNSPWADSCVSSIQSFFQRLIDAIVARDNELALTMLSALREPNETHLGLSRGRSRGSGVGDELARDVWESLSRSEAVRTGLIRDLEDTALLVPKIDKDRISDVTTNLIRKQLIEYTQWTSDFYGIPLKDDIASGPIWDTSRAEWKEEYVRLPSPADAKLLLVPKILVRRQLHMNAREFYRHHVLDFLVSTEGAARSLAQLASGRRRTKKAIEEQLRGQFDAGRHNPGFEKRVNTHVSEHNPELLNSYRQFKEENPADLLNGDDLADATGGPYVNLEELLAKVLAVMPGDAEADLYEKRIEALLTAAFDQNLVFPRRQHKIHAGRKRIDISYTNLAKHGFFYWLGIHYPAANVVVECKNYTRPLGNPELDQISGRFSNSRGRFGLLVYRGYTDKAKIWQSCLDTANDGNGFVLPLDDADLKKLVDERLQPPSDEAFGYLHELFSRLTGNR
ncbi:hypothetical protein [Dactylosporangium sp. CS-033363]|uniref:hypothetical protein n=1 Tax=Dactylosporangium sp. CS-033363 TaxID=3239935 RepID=UPI003D91DC28